MPHILDFLEQKYKPAVKAANLPLIKGKSTSIDHQLIVDLEAIVRRIIPKLSRSEMEDSIRWMLGWIKYTQDKNGVRSKYASRQYDRGRVIFIELHGHFGTELTYPHLAVVLANGFNWVLVAPISSGAFNRPTEPLYIDLVPGKDNVIKNCGVMLNNLRVISKNRIIDQFKKIGTPKLDEIDRTIVEHFIPETHKMLQDLKTQIITRDNEIEQLRMDNKQKDLEIIRLQQMVRDNENGNNLIEAKTST